MSNLESQNLPALETQISDELTTDDLEQVNGGFPPLLILGAGIVGRYVAKKGISGVIRNLAGTASRNAVREAVTEHNHAQQEC